jgi:hypothetical protein
MIVRALGGTLLALMLAVLGWRLSLFLGRLNLIMAKGLSGSRPT